MIDIPKYDYTDEVIKWLNMRIVRLFNSYKSQLKIDELNCLIATNALYEQLEQDAEKAFLKIANYYYNNSVGNKELRKKLKKSWLYNVLNRYEPTTKYVYNHEIERKSARFFESIIASTNKSEAIKIGKRYWSAMVTQYAILITDEAVKAAYTDEKIEKVKWVTHIDGRECSICRDRHGQIYSINKVPPKPHIGCRCVLVKQ